MLIEIKNQIENIIKLNDLNDIIRKTKITKIIVENLIIENEKNIKEIQNILNNNNLNIINNDIIERNNFKEINQKQNNNNFEIIDVRDFDTNK